ncbi:MAG: hypothetical protein HZC44_09360 [Geobacter sp.]|nr:hypothetical protein [Geobacter sp.]
MLVMVRYIDGNYDMVVAHRLDGLIKAGKILEFRRGNGWARIGRDSTRGPETDYEGEERRKGTSSDHPSY